MELFLGFYTDPQSFDHRAVLHAIGGKREPSSNLNRLNPLTDLNVWTFP
jgi:hypothetical protein